MDPDTLLLGNQAGVRPGATVQTYGGLAATSFGSALGDTVTPSGQSFSAVPSTWGIAPGATLFFGNALPDGNMAFAQMTLTDNEVFPTMLTTSIYIWHTASETLQNIPVPTTLGFFNPPSLNNASTGSAVDMVRAVTTPDGVHRIFAISANGYRGWQIGLYGEPYFLMAFALTNGVWAFDPLTSRTASQLAASSAAGAAAFPTSTNSFGETVYTSLGPSSLLLMPVSGDLVWGNYFYNKSVIPQLNSGSLVGYNLASARVSGFFQIPDVSDVNNVPLQVSVRDMCVNTQGSAGDERLVMTFDVFIRQVGATQHITYPGPPTTLTGSLGELAVDPNGVFWYCIVAGNPGTWNKGANYGYHPLMEASYSGTGFTLTSTPNVPITLADTGYNNDFGIAAFDPSGNFWAPTHGGVGLGVFASHETHLFEASGHTVPTFENGGPSATWFAGSAGQFPTILGGDFKAGCYARTGGEATTVVWDPVAGGMVQVGQDGKVMRTNPQTFTLGPELILGGTGSVTNWNGFFTSTVTTTSDSDFAAGSCLVLSSTAGAQNACAQGQVVITPGQNYAFTCNVKAPDVSFFPAVTAQLLWIDQSGTLLSSSTSPTVTLTYQGAPVTTVTVYGNAPAGAKYGTVLVQATANGAADTFRVGDASWKSEPFGTTSSVLDTNRVRVGATLGNPTPVKGDIVGGRLYFGLLNLITFGPTPTVTPVVSGAVTYTYFTVGIDANGAKSFVSGGTTIANGAATPDNTIGWTFPAGIVAVDILRGTTATSIALNQTGTSFIDNNTPTSPYAVSQPPIGTIGENKAQWLTALTLSQLI